MISLPSLDQNDVGLCAEFEWRDDCYGHRIVVQRGRLRQTAFEAAVGAGEWPVFQYLAESHDRDGRHVLLLTGADSKAHWSMGVHATAPGSICFDVACRLSAKWNEGGPQQFGASRYLSAGPGVDTLLKSNVVAQADGVDTTVQQNSVVIAVWSDAKHDSAQAVTRRWTYTLRRIDAE